MNTDLKYERANIELRRAEVLRLLAQGHSQSDIAKKLGVSNSLICLDIQWIKEKAKEDLRSHFQDRLPYEFARTMAGINEVLRRATELRDRMTDPKLQLQAMSLMAQLYGQIMNMASDGGVIQAAFEKVEQLTNKDRTMLENSVRQKPEELSQENIEESSSDDLTSLPNVREVNEDNEEPEDLQEEE